MDVTLLEQANADQEAIVRQMRPLALEDKTTLKVVDSGSGEVIIFLPMVAELGFVYTPQIEEFSIDHRVILYEPRLSWQSHFGIAARAGEVVALMNRLDLKSAHIVAWSDTGSAAYYLAKHWPERCQSIVFLGLADRYRFPQPLQFFTRVLARMPVERLVPSWILAWILARYLGGPRVNRLWVARRAAKVPHLSRLFKHSILPNLIEHQPVADEIKNVPCLVICGDNDALVSVEQASRMAKLLPNSREVAVITGGEHFLSYVNASSVNKIMREFYFRLQSTSTR